jgi:hypothetical protein
MLLSHIILDLQGDFYFSFLEFFFHKLMESYSLSYRRHILMLLGGLHKQWGFC